MKNFILITSSEGEYLGKISLTEEKKLKIEAKEKEKKFLEEILNKILEEGIKIRQGRIEKKDKKIVHITYFLPVKKEDPFYLEAVAEELKNRGFGALILDEKRAQLYILIKGSKVFTPEQKLMVIRSIRGFSEKEVENLIQILTKEKEGIEKIDKEFNQKFKELREKNIQKWKEAVAKERKRIIDSITQKLKEKLR